MLSQNDTYPFGDNQILSRLPLPDYERLRASLEPVRLPPGRVLFEAGETVRHAYFLTGGMVSILTATVSVTDVAVARENNPNYKSRADNLIQPGTKLSLEGIDWAKNGQTLLMAVSNKCHFCSESAPFYQQLARQHGKARLVAVLPQPVEDGKKYLEGTNVAVDDVRQAPLTALGIRGTPTLILVDNNGVAINSWVGKLAPGKEEEVLSSLQ